MKLMEKYKVSRMYLYRAMDAKGHTVDLLLSDGSNKKAALSFVVQALANNGSHRAALHQLNQRLAKTDKLNITQSRYANNRVEQDQ